MKVLITGGNGFVGLNTAELLLQKGIDIVLLSNTEINKNLEEKLSGFSGNLSYIQEDITSGLDKLYKIIVENQITMIIHAATITPNTTDEKKSSINIINVNVMGTLYILEAAVKANINKFIYISSATVYGSAAYDFSTLKEEETYPLPESFYSISKLTGEKIVLRYQMLHQLNTTILRVGAVYGPWEHDSGFRSTISPIHMITQLAMQGKTAILNRNSSKDWIYSRDVAKGLFKILKSNFLEHSIYNLGGSSTWSLTDWCLKLKEQYTDFDYEFGSSNEANIFLYEEKDRGRLSNERIINELKIHDFYTLDESFNDYMCWLKKNTI